MGLFLFCFQNIIVNCKNPTQDEEVGAAAQLGQLGGKQRVRLQSTAPLASVLGQHRMHAQLEEGPTEFEAAAAHPPLLADVRVQVLCGGRKY